MFSFEEMALTVNDLDNQKTIYYIDNFLVSEAITMIYGAPSQGKTWFMLAVSKFLAKRVKKIYYIDFDNPKRQLKERGVDWLISNYSNIKYFSKGGLNVTADGFLCEIKKNAFGQNYKDCIFIIDSTRDFVDNIHNDTQAKAFMQNMKDIRDSGGTVLLIHHATKNGKVIDGSSEFAKSADNVYEFKQKARIGNELQWSLRVENDRDAISDCGFAVDTTTLDLKDIDPVFSNMSEYEESFVNKAIEVLKKNPDGLNKKELLETLGFEKDDKTANDTINKFNAKFWECKQEKKGKPYNITLIA
ncbi:helicase RepA family protein [Aliarcobacter butzleri]|uniref:helicase RepA family protein n=1 Tax=Aliarcobacter butzleri TaxID=28197 RepID=UPI001EDD5D06|nr:helicase RepA family protein [Aliarcobacter butzleri]MCG3698859.1 helicase RepA family protein [Aliarcobacter butzleri]